MTNTTIKAGDNVSVHYRGTLEDGTEFDSSYSRKEPITFTVGSGQMIAGFDAAVVGMTTEETKTVTLDPEEAYGPSYPDRTTEMPLTAFPSDFPLEEGATVPLQGPGGQHLLASVMNRDEEKVTLDLNHPMAGKTLTFEIKIVNVDV